MLKGDEGMKQREKSIPTQDATRIPNALARLIELYTATNKPEETKQWRAVQAKYPESKLAEKKCWAQFHARRGTMALGGTTHANADY